MNPTWYVYHGAGTTYPATAIEQWQTMSISYGRGVATDPLASGRYQVTGRRPDLLPSIKIGDRILLKADQGSSPLNFELYCLVADLSVEYGETSSMDTWTLTAEDAHAVLGRSSITTSWSAGDIDPIINQVATAAGSGFAYTALAQNETTVSADSLTNANALTTVQQLFNSTTPIKWIARDTNILGTSTSSAAITKYATDVRPVPSGYFVYDELNFSGIADNYTPYIVNTSPAIGTTTAGSGKRSYVFESYNNNATQQQAETDRLSALLSSSSNVPNRISYTATQQAAALLPLPWQMNWVLGKELMVITFRGTTYNTAVIGGSINVTTSDTRVSLNLIPADWIAAFTLDDPVLGVLDQNKLF